MSAARRPNQRFVGVGEAAASEVRHRVGLAPNHVVQDPKTQILQRRANPKDVVIAADHPKRAVWLECPPAGAEPGMGKRVIAVEVREFIPVMVYPIDPAVIGPQQFAIELQIVGRISEDQIGPASRKSCQLSDTIANNDPIERRRCRRLVTHTHRPGSITQNNQPATLAGTIRVSW